MLAEDQDSDGAAGEPADSAGEDAAAEIVAPPAETSADDSPLPSWCAHVFVIDSLLACSRAGILAYALVSYLGGWFGLAPRLRVLGLLYAVLTCFALWYIVRANVALLKLRAAGAALGSAALVFAAVDVVAMGFALDQLFHARPLASLLLVLIILRVLYNGLYFVALWRTRPLLRQAAPATSGPAS